MGRSLRHMFCLFAMIAIMAGSVLSASMMAPEKTDPAVAQLALMGMTVDDICGDDTGHDHDHRCPFCHLTPDTPIPAAGGAVWQLTPHRAWRQATDLHRAAQARDHARAPRAPPSIV